MANIYDLANELERAIRVLPEYKKVEESRVAIDKDENAKKIFEAFTSVQKDFYAKLQSGEMPNEDEQSKIQELQGEIDKNPLLKNYFNAQQGLSVYVSDIEKIIFSPLQDLLK